MQGLPDGVRELDHTADTGIELVAPDLETLFDRGARALRFLAVEERPDDGGGEAPARSAGTARSFGEPPAGAPGGSAETHALDIEAGDPGTLLVRWLSELLYRIDTLGLAYETAELQVGDRRLRARIRETRLPEPGAHIKAITYHGLECGPRPDGSWSARVIFDI